MEAWTSNDNCQQSALDFTNPLVIDHSVMAVGLPARQEAKINPVKEQDKMSHLVSVVHQVSQQVVHVQDAALSVLQVVGPHGGRPVLPHTRGKKGKKAEKPFISYNR